MPALRWAINHNADSLIPILMDWESYYERDWIWSLPNADNKTVSAFLQGLNQNFDFYSKKIGKEERFGLLRIAATHDLLSKHQNLFEKLFDKERDALEELSHSVMVFPRDLDDNNLKRMMTFLNEFLRLECNFDISHQHFKEDMMRESTLSRLKALKVKQAPLIVERLKLASSFCERLLKCNTVSQSTLEALVFIGQYTLFRRRER